MNLKQDQITDGNSATSTRTTTNRIFKPLRDLIQDHNLLFLCNGGSLTSSDPKPFCNKLLFYSEHIDSIYVLDDYSVSFAMDTKEKCSNVKLDEEVMFKDDELHQTDCIFRVARCRGCNTLLGRYFISVSFEKEIILEKTIIFADKVKALKIETENTQRIDLTEFTDMNESNASEINEYKEVNLKMRNTFENIIDLVNKIGEYTKIKDSIKNTEEQLESLAKFANYISYSLNKLKSDKNIFNN